MKASHKILGIVIVLMVVVLIVLQWPLKTNKPGKLSESPKGGDFTLNAATGSFNLKSQRGKVVLIYFGYTFCPDICPTNLMLIAQAFNALNKDELARVQGVFISVDPERDTLDRLDAYTKYFHPSILGVTGKPDHIAKIAKQYGAVFRKVEGESKGGYLIDHSANTYVVAPDGSLNTILPHATPPEDIVKVIRNLLDKTEGKQSNQAY